MAPGWTHHARTERALSLTRGVRVSPTLEQSTDSTTLGGGVTPYLAVADARRALAWYADVFGARRRGEPIVMPDGRIGHAEIEVAGALVMLSDEHPEIGVVAPTPGQGAAVTLHAEIADVDGVAQRAVAAGAALERPPGDTAYGRVAVVRDPFGHRWMLTRPPAAPEPMREGDLVYVSLWVPEGQRAAAFFASVLGWEYEPGSGGQNSPSHQVAAATPRHGIAGGHPRSTLFLCMAVDDVAAAVRRVHHAGGRAQEPRKEPYGLLADCVDVQGVPFALYQLSGEEARPPANGARPGDLAYVTLEVVDSGAARAFYAAVLGWRFAPGTVPDGWTVDDVAPMTGMHGGHEQARTVPMYRVDDIDRAVGQVRAAGGTASDPQPQPYGVTAECVDDQGTRFWLGQV